MKPWAQSPALQKNKTNLKKKKVGTKEISSSCLKEDLFTGVTSRPRTVARSQQQLVL